MINFRLIRHLWLFLAVAEERHFGRAAQRLGMSQPPLSEQIQVLEQALQVKLFERSRRGTQLTPAGEALLPEVRKLADQLERIELAAREAVRGQHGMFAIGAVAAVMMDVLPELLTQLRQRHPQVTVVVKEIDSADALAALRAREIDLALVRLDATPEADIGCRPVRQDRLAVALPPDHALSARTRLRLADLASEDFVMFARRNSPSYFDTLINACTSVGFSPRIVHEVASVASQLAFVACGQGVALVPASLRRLASAHVVVRSLSDKQPTVIVSAVWSRTSLHPLLQEAVELASHVKRGDTRAASGRLGVSGASAQAPARRDRADHCAR